MGTCIYRLIQTIVIAASAVASAGPSGTFLFSLADTNGTRPYEWANLSWDAEHSELYVVDSARGSVHVFNDNGMEIFAFGPDERIGSPLALALAANGDLYVLSTRDGRWQVLLCDYRGQPRALLNPRGVPPAVLADFKPSTLAYVQGNLYLADKTAMRVLVVDAAATYVSSYDLAELLDLSETDRTEIRAFAVDASGSMYFTIPALFQAFVMAPDGSFRAFGARGSTPGKFNVVSGIAVDPSGYIYVTDMLRGVVIVFDVDLGFVTEFGGRGGHAGNLVAPLHLAVGSNRVFVSQSRGGVKTFALRVN